MTIHRKSGGAYLVRCFGPVGGGGINTFYGDTNKLKIPFMVIICQNAIIRTKIYPEKRCHLSVLCIVPAGHFLNINT